MVPAAQSPTKTTMRLDQDGLADLAYQTLFTGGIGLNTSCLAAAPAPAFDLTLP